MEHHDKKRLLNFHDEEEMAEKASINESRDSINSESCCSCGNPIKCLLPGYLKCYWKTIALAFFLLICGVSFLIMAVYIVLLPDTINGPHSYVFFLCGFICVVPGAYHVIYICFASRGREGYKLEELPTFTAD